jgi:hypothetical protein
MRAEPSPSVPTSAPADNIAAEDTSTSNSSPLLPPTTPDQPKPLVQQPIPEDQRIRQRDSASSITHKKQWKSKAAQEDGLKRAEQQQQIEQERRLDAKVKQKIEGPLTLTMRATRLPIPQLFSELRPMDARSVINQIKEPSLARALAKPKPTALSPRKSIVPSNRWMDSCCSTPSCSMSVQAPCEAGSFVLI